MHEVPSFVSLFLEQLYKLRWNGPITEQDIEQIDKTNNANKILKVCLEKEILSPLKNNRFKITPFGETVLLSKDFKDLGAVAPLSSEGRQYQQDLQDIDLDIRSNTSNILLRSSSIEAIAGERARKHSGESCQDKKALLIQKAKAAIANPVKLNKDTELGKANKMARAYEDALGVYQNNPTLKYLKGWIQRDSKNFSTWLRAALLAEQLDMSYDLFVKAQFYWYDKWFSKSPRPFEIASYKTKVNALERAKNFISEAAKGKINLDKPVVGRVRGSYTHNKRTGKIRFTDDNVAKRVKFENSQIQLQTLMKNYNASEESILKVFAKGTQATLYFDKDWLNQNKTYQKLKEQGDL